MATNKTSHDWSKDSLLNKALRYASLMFQQEKQDWLFGFWSAITLEMLTRAALANISPTLIADGKNWDNILYALGKQPNSAKFSPSSENTSTLLVKAESIFPEFTREMLSFSLSHIQRRNNELHTGGLPFDELGTSRWLPQFFSSCQVLLGTLDESLEFLFGDDEAETARELIEAHNDETAKVVKGTITAHKTLWDEKELGERENLMKQAELLSSRNVGHRVECPSCASASLLQGSAMGPPVKTIEDDMIIEKQSMLPSHFECVACGLKVLGFAKLNACGLGDAYTSTSHYDPPEYFGASAEWYGYDDDNNEP